MACASKPKAASSVATFSEADKERKITLKIGDDAPIFELENGDGVKLSLNDFRGKSVVLYFYPKDNTPGCTTEACEFSSFYDEFIKAGAVVIGISPDSVATHNKFAAKQNLKHILLSDTDKEVCIKYGVWQLRKNYGKEYMGVVRSTFIIDENSKIAKIYKSVKAAGHAAKVLADIEGGGGATSPKKHL